MNAGIDVGVVILITVIALLVFTTIIVIFSRYRKCPSDKILVVYGKIGTNKDGTARSATVSYTHLDILISHDIIDNIERDFLKDMGIHLVIHLDPVVTGDERTNALHGQVRECVHRIYPQASLHDFRVVWGLSLIHIWNGSAPGSRWKARWRL